MIQALWLALAVLSAACSRSHHSITNPAGSAKIHAAETPGQTSFLWKSSAVVHLSNGRLCSGVLIGSKWILTAGHCVDTGDRVEAPSSVSFFGSEGQLAETIKIRKTALHKQFEFDRVSEGNDLALLLLSRPVSARFLGVRIEEAVGTIEVGDSLIIAGSGDQLPSKGDSLNRLSQAGVSGLANHTMQLGSSTMKVRRIERSKLILSNSFTAICAGDSGSGLYDWSADEPKLVGIASLGDVNCTKPGTPATYTYLPFYKNWIDHARLQLTLMTTLMSAHDVDSSAVIRVGND